MPKISIIVPVYKVEKYLRRCLDSIVAQTFTDWECILVDDGSPDNSGKICDEYAEKDKRFRVFHQDNAGVSAARNKGLDEAKGEWIGFVDSDDWIEKETYEVAYNSAIKEDVNVICYGAKFYKNGEFSNVPFKDKGDIFYKFQHYRVYMHSLWNKLIKRELIDGKKIATNLKVCEDLVFNFDIMTGKDVSIKYLNANMYNYRLDSDSSSRILLLSKLIAESEENAYYKIVEICNAREFHNIAKTYLCFLSTHAALPYVNNIELFNPDKFRLICRKWSFYSYHPKNFFQFLFAFLKMDFLVKLVLRIKNTIKK